MHLALFEHREKPLNGSLISQADSICESYELYAVPELCKPKRTVCTSGQFLQFDAKNMDANCVFYSNFLTFYSLLLKFRSLNYEFVQNQTIFDFKFRRSKKIKFVILSLRYEAPIFSRFCRSCPHKGLRSIYFRFIVPLRKSNS